MADAVNASSLSYWDTLVHVEYEYDGRKLDEKIHMEDFPADNKHQATNFAVMQAMQYVREMGAKQQACTILRTSLSSDDSDKEKTRSLVPTRIPSKAHPRTQGTGTTYTPYKCPIVGLCETRYKAVISKNVCLLTREEK